MSADFWDRLFNWLEKVLPTAVGAFLIGRKMGASKTLDAEKKLTLTEYELDKSKNALSVIEQNRGKSPDEIIDDYLSDSNKRGKS